MHIASALAAPSATGGLALHAFKAVRQKTAIRTPVMEDRSKKPSDALAELVDATDDLVRDDDRPAASEIKCPSHQEADENTPNSSP